LRSGINTVLIIDDDIAAQEVLRETFEKAGFSVACAASGEEGLRLAKQLRPAAITLDILMPHMDGWGVLIRLKNDPITLDIPVVLVTIMDDKNLGYSLGAAEYMTKPVDRQRLVVKIKRKSPTPRESFQSLARQSKGSKRLILSTSSTGAQTPIWHHGLPHTRCR
jgi:CheY-like chemotaxis protein